MKYLSLFSGIGGFELGIQNAFQNISNTKEQQPKTESADNTQGRLDTNGEERLGCIGYSEIDKYAIQIYEKHFNHTNLGDITKIKAEELPDFDLLVGGFPCQAFSIAGKRRGFDDTRGTLFFDIARILKEKQPRLFLLENVKGLLSHDNGRTFKTIISTLTELGYDLQWEVLNSKNFGVPQNRERVYIIGHLRGTSRPEVFPIREDYRTDNQQSELRIRRELLQGNELRTIQEEEKTSASKSSGQIIRKDWNKPDNPDSGRWQTHTDDYRIRRLTPVECARLQGFPDNWHKGVSDTQAYKCYGNAVTVNVIEYLITRIYETI